MVERVSGESPAAGKEPAPDAAAWSALAAMMAVAAVLRFWHIGAQSLWLDEASSWLVARMPPLYLLTHNVDHGNPPGFYILLAGWMRLFGQSEVVLRALPALAGVLSVPALFLLGRELFGRRAGLLAALLLALSPIQVAYGQEARGYTLVMLLGILCAWMLARAQRTDRWLDWLAAAGFAALGFHVHYTAALLVPFAGMAVITGRRSARALAAAGAYGLLVLPGALLYLVPSFLSSQGYSYYLERVTPGALARMCNTFFGRPVPPDAPTALLAAGALLLLVAVGYPLCMAVLAAVHEPERPGDLQSAICNLQSPRPVLFALLYLAVPVLLFAAYARMKPVWEFRYVMVAFPGYLLLAGWALATAGRHVRAVLATSLVLLTLPGLAAVYARPKSDWRSAAAAIRRVEAAPGGAHGVILITAPFMTIPLDYYYHGRLPQVGFPRTHGPMGAVQALPLDGETLEALSEEAERHRTVLVVYGHGVTMEGLRVARRVAELRGTGRMLQLPGVTIFAFGRAAGALGGEVVTREDLVYTPHAFE